MKINFRKRYLVITLRIILGLMFIMSGITGLLAGAEMHNIPEPMVAVSQQLWSMGIFQMIKITEIISGLMLIFSFFPALALLFVSPICVGIIVFDLHVAPQYLPSGIFVTILTAYLGYAYWDKYKAIFNRS
jgi:putative oxidoreductase